MWSLGCFSQNAEAPSNRSMFVHDRFHSNSSSVFCFLELVFLPLSGSRRQQLLWRGSDSMEKFKRPEDPWSLVVRGSLPLGRISHWLQEKGQIKSTPEDRNEERKCPCCVPGGTPVGHPEHGKALCPQPETGMGSYSLTLQH